MRQCIAQGTLRHLELARGPQLRFIRRLKGSRHVEELLFLSVHRQRETHGTFQPGSRNLRLKNEIGHACFGRGDVDFVIVLSGKEDEDAVLHALSIAANKFKSRTAGQSLIDKIDVVRAPFYGGDCFFPVSRHIDLSRRTEAFL